MRISRKGALALAIALLELSFLPIMLGVGGAKIGSIQLLFYTFIVAAAVSLPISYVYDKEGLLKLLKSRKSLAIIVVAGLCNNAVSQLLLSVGTVGTNPSISAIVFRSWILIAALMTPFILRIKVSKAQLGVTVLGFMGLYLMVSNGTALSINMAQLPYLSMLIASAAVYSISPLIMRLYNTSLTASIAVFNITSVAFMALIAPVFHTSLAITFTVQSAGIILFLGVVTYGIGTTLYFYSYRRLNPIFVSNAIFAVPFMTIFLSALLVGTPIKAYYIYSLAIIVAAVVVQQRLATKVSEHISRERELKRIQIFDVTSAFVNNNDMMELMREDGRALAVKQGMAGLDIKEHAALFDKHRCLFFTNLQVHDKVNTSEIEFISEVVGLQPNEVVLVGVGNAADVERAIAGFTKSQKTVNNF